EMVHVDSRGQFDSTFGTNGIVALPEFTTVQQIVTETNGTILLSDNPMQFFQASIQSYTSDGSIDASFGTDGTVQIPSVAHASLYSPPFLTLMNDDMLLFNTSMRGLSRDPGSTT